MAPALSYQYGYKKSVAYFLFKQLSIIPVVSLLLTFNKDTASGNLSFLIHQFYVSKYNQWEWTQVFINIWEQKKKLSTGKKTIEEKQTILLESMQRLS